MNGPNPVTSLNVHSMNPMITRDDEIVSAVKAGSPGAFAKLHAIYSQRLYKTIFAITKSAEDAEDALQETFLRAYLGLHSFQGRSTLYSWLTRIAINSALLILRKRSANPEILFDPQPDAQAEAMGFEVKDSAPNPEEDYDLHQRRARLLAAIRNLSPRLQEPVLMRLTQESSVKEIGDALKLSEAVIKSRLHRARLRLSTSHGLKVFRCH